jgi:hypothetical protein
LTICLLKVPYILFKVAVQLKGEMLVLRIENS